MDSGAVWSVEIFCCCFLLLRVAVFTVFYSISQLCVGCMSQCTVLYASNCINVQDILNCPLMCVLPLLCFDVVFVKDQIQNPKMDHKMI